MEVERAKELLTDDNYMNSSDKNTVMRGLQLLAKYQEDVRPEFDHDILWASNFEDTVAQMSKGEVVQMGKWGWFFDETNDCWAHY